MLKSLEIYGQRNTLKIVVVLNLLLVGTASQLYTNMLIDKLEAREERYMQLYAHAQEYVSSTDVNEDITFILTEVIQSDLNNTIPAIYVDATGHVSSMNIDVKGLTKSEQEQFLKEELAEMKEDHPPIRIGSGKGRSGYIYYSNSALLKQLRHFPYIQLITIIVLGFLAYLAFSSSRRAEQNRVWVGLAKETAHQLGTPLSSLMAWVEYFRTDPTMDQSITDEIEKDVNRLETIATRFSSIGSVPTLKDEDIYETVHQFISYLEKRISTKVKMRIDNQLPEGKTVAINKLLFEWVIENICKNAVDAMGGIGSITITLRPINRRKPVGRHTPGDNAPREIAIDIADTGKGISKANLQKVFTPGYSTKKRGWGLGLTLAKRIIEEYHNGRLYVKSSEPGKGTTFRISLKENVELPGERTEARSEKIGSRS